MCLPIIAAAAVVAIAGTIEKAYEQNKRAKQNKAAALQAEIENFSALDARGREEAIAAVNQKADIGRQAVKDTGIISTAATASGVAGNSVSAVLHQVDADKARADNRIEDNLNTEYAQLDREKLGVSAQAQDRINAIQPANPFAVGIEIAGDVVSAYSKAYGGMTPKGG